ncbi:DUF488 family protein [Streptomyces sp. NPDC056683]|uniref:DUF488 domain-containing protein n=1 Tax=Streptomyces sp. NPDC056683 TaxID=3345910 RepID=UPI0036CE2A83
MARIICRRVHEQPPDVDREVGERVLVDRVRPEGMRRQVAPFDEWLREVAPSVELQRWYGHNPRQFGEFRRRCRTELGDQRHRYAAARLRDLAEHHRLTLLTATRDVNHSHTSVLAEWLAEPGPPDEPRQAATPARPGRTAPGPPPPGHRAALSEAVAGLNPGALACVMGTGIVSTALYVNGAGTFSAVLL